MFVISAESGIVAFTLMPGSVAITVDLEDLLLARPAPADPTTMT